MANKTRSQDRRKLIQEQEVHQYFQPWLSAHGSAFSVASNVESIAAGDLQELGYNAQRSRDKALSSFAQLAALRLNVRRAMVSLIDSKHQYILTEATRTQSFLSDGSDDSEDNLWLGNSILKREEAVCCHCFYNTYTANSKTGEEYKARGLVVDDCRADERFKNRSYVVAEPGVRFYAGVPIVTRSGQAIGAYAVSDESPRDGLSIEEFKYMQDVAFAVMEHLEWAKDRVDRFKGERIIRGLTSFLDGSRPTPKERLSTSGRKDHEKGDIFAQLNARSKAHIDDLASEFAPGKRLAFLENRDTLHSDTDSDYDSSENGHSTLWTEQSRARAANEDLDQLLCRAAKSLRKCTLADGVLFFKASEEPVTDQDAAILRRSSDTVMTDDTRASGPDTKAIGISLAAKAEEQFAEHCTLSKITLETYISNYPEGRAFHFNACGEEVHTDDEESSDDDDDTNTSWNVEARGIKRKRRRRSTFRMSHEEILEKLPGVRKLVFLPLRDFITGKWIAGGFLWTSTFGRMMNMEEDMPHLKAFANGIVSEVVRMNVEQLSRSKTAFIASMSHELRSPLHGILGSVEFINDTFLDSFQSGLITSITNCSRTLLDTLSNLLSYAKVSQTETASATAEVDLALLVEEVVEAVYAGHTFRKQHTASITALQDHGSPDVIPPSLDYTTSGGSAKRVRENSIRKSGAVSILLEVAPSPHWRVHTNPGAFRRVVMNLVGNALKYTTKGCIAIGLRTQQEAGGSRVVLKVQDTGKGISGAFLKNNLFQPFKQEDTFASGTGLGLSIVKQLVESLEGQISVQSILGKGTEFQILLPMKLSATTGEALPDDGEDMSELTSKTQGMTAAVINPEGDHSPSASLASLRLRSNLAELCSSWFGMAVSKPKTDMPRQVDFLIYSGSPPLGMPSPGSSQQDVPQARAALVVVPSGAEAVHIAGTCGAAIAHLASVVEVVPQPCGPRKIAKAIKRCLDRLDQDHTIRGGSPPAASTALLTLNEGSTTLPNRRRSSILSSKAASSPPILRQSSTDETIPPSPTAHQISSLANTAAATSDENSIPTPTTRHVLIADDNPTNTSLLSTFCTKLGLRHTLAADGSDAVAAFEAAAADTHNDKNAADGNSKIFDVILMDVSMPVMDGLQATRHIRRVEAERGLARTRIVALSAWEGGGEREGEARAAGVDGWLSKPVGFGRLREILLEGGNEQR